MAKRENKDDRGRKSAPSKAGGIAVAPDDLLNSPEFFQEMLKISVDAVIVVDGCQKIIVFNQGAEKIFGYRAEEIVGRSLELLLPPDAVAVHAGYLDTFATGAVASRPLGSRGTIQGRRRDGSLFPAETSISRLVVNGETVFTAILRDVSERQAAEAAIVKLNAELTARSQHLEQLSHQLMEISEQVILANRAKSEFLTNTSHELRTPLNAIIGFSGILLANIFDEKLPPLTTEYIEYINKAGLNLLATVDDVLDVASFEAGDMNLQPEAVPTLELVSAIMRVINPRCEAKRQHFRFDVARAPPTLYLDPRRARQFLLNLLSNAVKFTPERGRIVAAVDRTETGALRFVITDNGIGMDDAALATAFTLFGRIETAMSGQYGGTGLGLPLANRLIEAHGGRLTLTSRPGEGTTATALLPASCIIPDEA